MNKNETAKKANETVENITAHSDLLETYRDQTVTEGKHDYHVDGYYGDYSDDCCC